MSFRPFLLKLYITLRVVTGLVPGYCRRSQTTQETCGCRGRVSGGIGLLHVKARKQACRFVLSTTSSSRVSKLIDPELQTVKASEYWDDKDSRENPWYSELPEFRALSSSELPSGTAGGNTYTSASINPDFLLPWLQKRLEDRYSVLFVRDTVPSLAYAKQRLNCQAVVNASGLGALELAGDKNVVSIRGQTAMIKNAAFRAGMDREVYIRRGREYTYAIPRLSSGGIIVGGIEDEKRTTSEVDAEVRLDIIRRVNAMLKGQLEGLDVKRDVIRDIVGFRPWRRGGYRVEREGSVVHAYGFAGAGYRYSWGAAAEVARLVDELGLGVRQKL